MDIKEILTNLKENKISILRQEQPAAQPDARS